MRVTVESHMGLGTLARWIADDHAIHIAEHDLAVFQQNPVVIAARNDELVLEIAE